MIKINKFEIKFFNIFFLILNFTFIFIDKNVSFFYLIIFKINLFLIYFSLIIFLKGYLLFMIHFLIHSQYIDYYHLWFNYLFSIRLFNYFFKCFTDHLQKSIGFIFELNIHYHKIKENFFMYILVNLLRILMIFFFDNF